MAGVRSKRTSVEIPRKNRGLHVNNLCLQSVFNARNVRVAFRDRVG